MLTDKRIWTVIGSIVAALLIPFILLIMFICSLLSMTANHNNAAIDLSFNGGAIPASMPAEYRDYINEMRECFGALDSSIGEVESMMEDGSLDDIRVKAVFYALYFGTENLRLHAGRARAFVDCFVIYETREDEDGDEYEVAIPIDDLPTVYANVAALIGRPLTPEDQANITEIWLRVKYNNFDPSADMPLEGGNGTHDLIGELADPDKPLEPGEIGSPLAGGWRDKVTSEFGCLNLHSVFQKGTVEFRLFNGTLHAGKIRAYLSLALAVTAQALNQSCAGRRKTQSSNEKYTFRTWLLRLGMIGKEFENPRKHLLEHLDGNIAWKDPAQAERQRERIRLQREQQMAEQAAPWQTTSAEDQSLEPGIGEESDSGFSMSMK